MKRKHSPLFEALPDDAKAVLRRHYSKLGKASYKKHPRTSEQRKAAAILGVRRRYARILRSAGMPIPDELKTFEDPRLPGRSRQPSPLPEELTTETTT